MILLLAAKLAAPYLGSICWLSALAMASSRGGRDCEPLLVNDVRDRGGVVWHWTTNACHEEPREVYYRTPAVLCTGGVGVTCSRWECSR